MKTVISLLFCTMVLCLYGNSGQQVAPVEAGRHYDAAMAQLDEGATVAEVFETLDKCLAADSTFENAYFLKAYVFYKLQDFEAAIREYDKLLRINPYHEEALKNRALTRLQVYDLEGALADHNRRQVLEPRNPNIYFDRAYCKGLLNDIQGSIADYTRAIDLDPSFTQAIANRGKAKLNLATGEGNAAETVTLDDACRDLNRAQRMGDDSSEKLILEYCTRPTAEDK